MKTEESELGRNKLDLVALQEVTQVENGSWPENDYKFSTTMEMLIFT
jgi:hypothetical protein